MVQNLYSDGHEFASHTVSHPAENELRNFDQYKWTKEIIGMFKIVSSKILQSFSILILYRFYK